MPACRAAPSTAVVGLLAVAVLAACCLAAGAQAGPEGVPPPPDAQAGGATQPSAAVRPTTTVAFHERPPDADVYRLTLYWPPTVLDAEQQAVARFSVDKGWASPGAWALALQPSRQGNPQPAACPAPPLAADALGGWNATLAYYMSGANHQDLAADVPAWGAAWARDGACTGLSPLAYFMAFFQAAAQSGSEAAVQAVQAASNASAAGAGVEAALGVPGSLAPPGLLCAGPGQAQRLGQFTLCVDPSTLTPVACPSAWAAALPGDAVLAAPDLAPCAAAAPIVVPSLLPRGSKPIIPGLLRNEQPVILQPLLNWWWSVAAVGLLLGVLGVLALTLLALARARAVPSLFRPRRVTVVHNPLVCDPVVVRAEPLDLAWAASVAPALAATVADCPVGVGFKGGIARKLLKHRFGTPEPGGKFDVDVCVVLPSGASAAARRRAKQAIVGSRLGEFILEAQDCEVEGADELLDYFVTRDVTLNEVLLIRVSPENVMLLYTDAAAKDAERGVVRPSVHARAVPYTFVWDVDGRGRPYVVPRPIARSIIRRLKGHGSAYAFDPQTVAHYKKARLGDASLFQILRPFHDNDAKFLAALDHLVGLGFVSRRTIAAAGGPNRFWGALLKSINAGATLHGGRMGFGELDLAAVEEWAEKKKASIGAGIISRQARAPRAGYVASDESAKSLGLVRVTPEAALLLDAPPTFDPAAHAAARGGIALDADDDADDGETPLGLAGLVLNRATAAAERESGAAARLQDVVDAAAATGAARQAAPLTVSGKTMRRTVNVGETAAFVWHVVCLDVWHAAAALALLLACLAVQLYVPHAAGWAFNTIVARDSATFPLAFIALTWSSLGFLVLEYGFQLVVQRYCRSLVASFFARLYACVLRKPVAWFANISLGELLSRLTGDALAVKNVVTSALPKLVTGALLTSSAAVLVLVRCSMVAAKGDAHMLALAAVVLAVAAVEWAAFGRMLWSLAYARRAALGRLFALTLRMFSDARALSTLGLEARASSDYAALSKAFSDLTFWVQALEAAHETAVAALTAALELGILWLGGSLVLKSRKLDGPDVEVGFIISLLLYTHWVQEGLKSLATGLSAALDGAGSVRRLVEVVGLDMFKPEFVPPSVAAPEGAGDGPGWPSPPPGLVDAAPFASVSLRLRAGGPETIVPAGNITLLTVGSDKDAESVEQGLTLGAVPPNGGVTLHFSDGRCASLADVLASGPAGAAYAHERATLVSPAAAHVFVASVEDNVAVSISRPSSSSEVAAACRAAGLDAWASSLSDGYRSLVGPRTTGPLPWAVRARIALARAFLRSPWVVVVDDPVAVLAAAPVDMKAALRGLASQGCAVVLLARRGAADLGLAQHVADRAVDISD